jgi:predicted GH43/DUF377 family glycosyl hydrolase
MSALVKLLIGLVLMCVGIAKAAQYEVKVVERSAKPVLSFIDGTSTFQQIFNPTYIEPSPGTSGKEGLLARTQNCNSPVNATCVFCGGSQDKASILTFSSYDTKAKKFQTVTENSVVFGPFDNTDSWGTEDPRMKYNPHDQLYYMFYTAYNGSAIFLNMATSPNPTDASRWQRHGPVFPSIQNSKSGALLIRDSPPHYLLWGDSSIRIAQSNDLLTWPEDGGSILLSPRTDSFDSRLVESGPPPLRLSDGNYLFFYNSAQVGWPDDPATTYNVGWLILDGNDPSVILQRSEEPLMRPKFAYEIGASPYACNVPNVVFLEAAFPLPHHEGKNVFQVYFGGADATIGSAVIEVAIKQ